MVLVRGTLRGPLQDPCALSRGVGRSGLYRGIALSLTHTNADQCHDLTHRCAGSSDWHNDLGPTHDVVVWCVDLLVALVPPVPKPVFEKKPRKLLKASGSSSLTRSTRLKSTTPIKKENPVRQSQRRKLTAKFHRTPAFIAAGEAAKERAGGRCEYLTPRLKRVGVDFTPGFDRCTETENLERHCKSYPKTRPIAAKDIEILCPCHHQFVEMTQFPTRKRR